MPGLRGPRARGSDSRIRKALALRAGQVCASLPLSSVLIRERCGGSAALSKTTGSGRRHRVGRATRPPSLPLAFGLGTGMLCVTRPSPLVRSGQPPPPPQRSLDTGRLRRGSKPPFQNISGLPKDLSILIWQVERAGDPASYREGHAMDEIDRTQNWISDIQAMGLYSTLLFVVIALWVYVPA